MVAKWLVLMNIGVSQDLVLGTLLFNTLRPRQNGRLFADDIFKWIFLNENVWISIKSSLKFVHMCPIKNIPILVQVMAWRLQGDKPLSEPMMVRLPRLICVTRPQWVNIFINGLFFYLRGGYFKSDNAEINTTWNVHLDLNALKDHLMKCTITPFKWFESIHMQSNASTFRVMISKPSPSTDPTMVDINRQMCNRAIA